MNHSLRMTILSVFLALGSHSTAVANEQLCEDIIEQLNSEQTIIGNTAEARYLTRAIAHQNSRILQIRNDMRRSSCSIGSVIIYGKQNASLCGELGDQLIEARAELDYLTAKKIDVRLSRQVTPDIDERRELIRTWDETGCDKLRQVPLNNDLTTAPMTPVVIGRDSVPLNQSITIIAPRQPMAGMKQRELGSLRALCVRTCDGKFFPLSSNASPLDFSSLATQCQAACPASQTELYYHSLNGQETKDMVSTTSARPYTALPNAYLFQKPGGSNDQSCSCGINASLGFIEKSASPDNGQPPALKKEPDIAQPTQVSTSKPKLDEGTPYVPGERKIRAVGPQFFPQDNAIDLSKPAVPGAQPQQ